MDTPTKLFKWLLWGVLGFVLLTTVTLYFMQKIMSSQTMLPVLGQVPAFEFVERSGQPFGLDEMKGSVTVVDFMFTRCPSICPLMTAKMKGLYDFFADTDQVRFVSISVDPENDSLQVLQEYAKSHGIVDNRWLFLRAPLLADVQHLSEGGFKLGGDLPANHSTKFVLVDQHGRIRGYYDSYDDERLEALKAAIRTLFGNES